MNYITIFVCFSFYKFISRNIFFILFSIFILSNRISFFIYKFSNYRWTRSGFFLVDMFCITLIISFGSYKYISINIFFLFCSIFFWRNSLAIFVYVFCNYISRWCDFLLVDMFCITLFISFGSYKFIAIYIFFGFCSIFFWSNSITIFVNVFCNYICWSGFWSKLPSSYKFYIFIFYSFVVFIVTYKFPSSIFYFNCFCLWL